MRRRFAALPRKKKTALALVLFTFASTRLEAQDEMTPVVLPVTINGVAKGEVVCLLHGADVLVRVRDLEEAGVRGLGGQRVVREGEEFVSLTSLGPAASFQLDMEAVALAISLPPEMLGRSQVAIGYGRPVDLEFRRDPAAFLNYSVDVQDDGSFTGFAELGASVGPGLWYTSGTRLATGGWLRGQTNLTVDNPTRLQRWVFGDAFAFGGELGGGTYLAGVSLSKDFELDPYFIRFPTVELSGALNTPSRVDVYVNGALVRQQQLPPGLFQLRDLPVPAGRGEVKVVIRDAFGQERELVSPFYVSSELLAPGLSEYRYSFGFRRNNVGSESFDYGDWVFLGRHRWGWTPSVTVEGRLEADPNLISAGSGLVTRLPFGDASFHVAFSKEHDRRGTAGSVSYRYLSRRFSAGTTYRFMSDGYSHLSLTSASDRPSREAQVFAGVSLGPASLSLNYSLTQMRDQGERKTVSLTSNWTSRFGTLLLSAGRRLQNHRWATEAFVGWTYSLGRWGSLGVSGEKRGGDRSASVQLSKPLPWGPGFGYRLQVRQGEQGEDLRYGVLQAQSAYGRYELTLRESGGDAGGSLLVSGGVVWLGGRVFASRQVGRSFALLRVPGVAGVTGLLNHQPVGKTNARGDLLVTELAPYYGNILSIRDEEIPLDYQVAGNRKVLAVPYRGGAVAEFPVWRVQSFRGRLVVSEKGEERTPAYGQVILSVEGREVISPIGHGGEFEFESLKPGSYTATVEDKHGTCRFTLEIPKRDEVVVDLGLVRCHVDGTTR